MTEDPQADPAVLTRVLDGEAVLFDSRTGTVTHLNPSASAVWMLLDGTQPLPGVVSELAGIFDAPLEVILPDVAAAVADFGARGLLMTNDRATEEPRPRAPEDPGGLQPADAPWPAETVRIGPFAAGGQPFVIDCNDAAFATEVAHLLRDLGATTGTDEAEETARCTEFLVLRREPELSHPWAVWRDGEPCEVTVSEDYVRPYIAWEITRLVIEAAHPLIPVHAAGVARDGRALVLAGASHSGKSTLAGWLTAHGWEFLTDEVALLDHRPDGSVVVHPFWRPIGVRRPGPLDEYVEAPTNRAEVLIPASQLGRLGTTASLSAIVFPRHEPGSEPVAEPRSRAEAVRELATHLPTLGSRGEAVFDAIVGITGAVPSYALPVNDLAAAAVALERLT